MPKQYCVTAHWDEEACVWWAESDNPLNLSKNPRDIAVISKLKQLP
ncbi:MAG: DUF1902 domain-containing protein [Methylococcaceae bacterium]|nr:MAG: DUF1902 domain-containing protein [Methylococcaceae bacterium]